jgi:rubrerythrin
MTLKEFLENATQEQKEKLSTCKTSQEVLTLAKELGIILDEKQAGEISDEELEAITGGFTIGYCGTSIKNPYRICPNCGASGQMGGKGFNGGGKQTRTCTVCGYVIVKQ